MNEQSEYLLVLSACAPQEAPQIARALVEGRLAACVNVLERARSFYRWQGRVEEAAECVLLIKTTAAAYPALEEAMQRLHGYELPEIIAVSVCAGSEKYLDWVKDNVD